MSPDGVPWLSRFLSILNLIGGYSEYSPPIGWCLMCGSESEQSQVESHLCDSAASPDSKLKSQLCYPLMYFLSPTWMWEELRSCPARLGEPATQLMFSLIWVGWLTPPGWAESMFLSHKMSGKIKTSQEIKYIMGLLSWNINFESGDAAEILTVTTPTTHWTHLFKIQDHITL